MSNLTVTYQFEVQAKYADFLTVLQSDTAFNLLSHDDNTMSVTFVVPIPD